MMNVMCVLSEFQEKRLNTNGNVSKRESVLLTYADRIFIKMEQL